MPTLARYIDVPCVDERRPHAYVFRGSLRQRYTPAFAHALAQSRADERLLIVTCPTGGALSALAAQALREAGGRLVIRMPGGFALDAWSGMPITSFDQCSPELPTGFEGLRPGAVAVRPVVGFDILLHHRADTSVRIGSMWESMTDALHVEETATWGRTEPLTRAWSVGSVTDYMQRSMPGPGTAVLQTPTGSWGQIRCRRSARGVTERLTGGVFLPAALTSPQAAALVDIVTALHDRTAVVFAMFTAAQAETGGWERGAPREASRLAALAAGPMAYRFVRINPRRLSGRATGSAANPLMAWTFEDRPHVVEGLRGLLDAQDPSSLAALAERLEDTHAD